MKAYRFYLCLDKLPTTFKTRLAAEQKTMEPTRRLFAATLKRFFATGERLWATLGDETDLVGNRTKKHAGASDSPAFERYP